MASAGTYYCAGPNRGTRDYGQGLSLLYNKTKVQNMVVNSVNSQYSEELYQIDNSNKYLLYFRIYKPRLIQ